MKVCQILIGGRAEQNDFSGIFKTLFHILFLGVGMFFCAQKMLLVETFQWYIVRLATRTGSVSKSNGRITIFASLLAPMPPRASRPARIRVAQFSCIARRRSSRRSSLARIWSRSSSPKTASEERESVRLHAPHWSQSGTYWSQWEHEVERHQTLAVGHRSAPNCRRWSTHITTP